MTYGRDQSGRRQRGASLVEAALVAPVFLMMLFAIMEFGFVFKDRLTVDNSTRVAARSASVSGRRDEADFLIIQSALKSLQALDVNQVEMIVVYKAATADTPIPNACLSGPVDHVCNHYDQAALSEPLYLTNGLNNDYWGCVPGTSADRYWCPGSRNTTAPDPTAIPPEPGPDYAGVYIRSFHPYITGFFGSGVELNQTAIVRIEPDS